MRIRDIVLLPMILFVTSACQGQTGQQAVQESGTGTTEHVLTTQPEDSVTKFVKRVAANLDTEDFGRSVQTAGTLLLGRPYVAGMLDATPSEELVVSVESFDCVLLVEAVLAATRAAELNTLSRSAFSGQIELMRYRSGQLDGFCSRLHYFSDWIVDNEAKGLIQDVTKNIGGELYIHELDFMSSNRSLYKQIAVNDSLFNLIEDSEISLRDKEFYYIPQSKIRNSYAGIEAGDIIAITTAVAGLDISHTGIAYVNDGTVGFLHASTSGGVKIAPDLSDYVNRNAKQTGIMVARPLSPRK